MRRPKNTSRKPSSFEKRIGAKVCQTPKVSVVIPAYDVSSYIGETLDSVLNQTYSDYETIVINDGSPDKIQLEEALKPYFDHIIYIEQENGGASKARNTGIDEAKGAYIAFLDGDDLWFPTYLDSQLSALEDKKSDMIYSDALLFGSVQNESETYMLKAPSSGEVNAESLISASCNVATSGTVIKKEKLLEHGLFDENLPPVGIEDFELWFRLAKNNVKICYQKKVLLKYRVRSSSLSGSNVERAKRNVIGLQCIDEKHELTQSETQVLSKQINIYRSEVELEKGKSCIAKKDFKTAIKHLSEANRYSRKQKLTLLILLLKIAPVTTYNLFKKLRPVEFSFISAEQK